MVAKSCLPEHVVFWVFVAIISILFAIRIPFPMWHHLICSIHELNARGMGWGKKKGWRAPNLSFKQFGDTSAKSCKCRPSGWTTPLIVWTPFPLKTKWFADKPSQSPAGSNHGVPPGTLWFAPPPTSHKKGGGQPMTNAWHVYIPQGFP